MPRSPGPAVVYLRMSPQLREGLRAAAADAGCSLNAFAVQVLATAAGDPARYRGGESHAARNEEIERDALGFPLEWKAKWAHSTARTAFICEMDTRLPRDEVTTLVKHLDAHNPGFFVEWRRLRAAEDAARNGRLSA